MVLRIINIFKVNVSVLFIALFCCNSTRGFASDSSSEKCSVMLQNLSLSMNQKISELINISKKLQRIRKPTNSLEKLTDISRDPNKPKKMENAPLFVLRDNSENILKAVFFTGTEINELASNIADTTGTYEIGAYWQYVDVGEGKKEYLFNSELVEIGNIFDLQEGFKQNSKVDKIANMRFKILGTSTVGGIVAAILSRNIWLAEAGFVVGAAGGMWAIQKASNLGAKSYYPHVQNQIALKFLDNPKTLAMALVLDPRMESEMRKWLLGLGFEEFTVK